MLGDCLVAWILDGFPAPPPHPVVVEVVWVTGA